MSEELNEGQRLRAKEIARAKSLKEKIAISLFHCFGSQYDENWSEMGGCKSEYRMQAAEILKLIKQAKP